MGGIHFTKEEREYVFKNFSLMSNQEIANNLGVKTSRIKTFADNNNLKKNTFTGVYVTEENKKYILKQYNRKSSIEISKDVGISQRDVNFIAYENKEKLIKQKYLLNENYFEIIDSPNKAYWLGFLYADGCILDGVRSGRKKPSYTLEISLAQKDKGHIELFRMCIGSNAPIKEKQIQGGKYMASRLTITNEKICKDLINLGCTPRKSLTLTFPTEEQVPKHLQRHFIRGYFDGDGCAYNGDVKPSVSFVGTESFLKSLQTIVYSELGLTKTTLTSKGNAFQCGWGGQGNARTWHDYLYPNVEIVYLPRKFEVLTNAI